MTGTSTPGHSGTVLLTGGTGFIGRGIQRALQNVGWSTRVVMRPGSPNRHQVLDPDGMVESALAETGALRAAVQQSSRIVYAAGSVRGRHRADFEHANVSGVAALLRLRAAANPGIPFLLISSLAAARPELSDYAASKRRGEEVLEMDGSGCWSILRPTAVYGPGDRELRPLLMLARRGIALRTGPPDQRLSLIHVDDLAQAVLAWLRDPWACNRRVFEVDDGHPQGYGWEDIVSAAGSTRCRTIAVPGSVLTGAARLNLLGSRLRRRLPMLTPGKARELIQARWVCDNAPFSEATGWRPQTSLTAGIEHTFASQ